MAINLLKKRSLSSLESSSARLATRKNDTRKWDMLRKQVLVVLGSERVDYYYSSRARIPSLSLSEGVRRLLKHPSAKENGGGSPCFPLGGGDAAGLQLCVGRDGVDTSTSFCRGRTWNDVARPALI